MVISFIILNYRSEKYLEKCLSSIGKNISDLEYEIIVVNNDPEKLKLSLDVPALKILDICSNVGFSKACNLGAKIAKGKFLYFLNPDTELLDNDIANSLFLLDKHDIGILAPSLITADGKTQPWGSGTEITPLKTLLTNFFQTKKPYLSESASVSTVDWVSGAAFLIKKDLFEKIGGFDENFFMYFEDVDLCKRVKNTDKKILLLSSSRVLHHGGGSSENNHDQKKIYYASQDHYFKKHFGLIQSKIITIVRKPFVAIKNSRNLLFHLFLSLCAFLPLQFALNPTKDIDLAVIRVLIPLFFITCLFIISAKKGCSQIKNKTTYYISAFLAMTLFSFFFSQNLQWSIRKLAFLFSIFPIYFIALFLLTTEERKRKTVTALVFGGSLVSFFAILQFSFQFFLGIDRLYSFLGKFIMPFFIGNNFSKEVLNYPSWLVNSNGITYMRAFAPFPDPHMLSYFVGMLLPWSIALWSQSASHKKLFLITSFLLAICDIATFTRGGYLALMVSAIIILPLVSRKTAWKILSGICLFAFLFFAVPKNPVTSPIAGRITATFDINEGSNQGRIAIWKSALSIISRNPQGVGIGSYSLAIDKNATYRTPIYTHNIYLDIAAELGIIAAFIFLMTIATTLKNFLEASKENPFYIAGIVSIAIFAIHSLVESPLYSVHVLPLLLIILAISSKNKRY